MTTPVNHWHSLHKALGMINQRVDNDTQNRDFYDRACYLDLVVAVFLRDELRARDAEMMEIAKDLDYDDPGWAVIGMLVTFDVLREHPDLCVLLVERVYRELVAVFLDGKDPRHD